MASNVLVASASLSTRYVIYLKIVLMGVMKQLQFVAKIALHQVKKMVLPAQVVNA